MSDNAISSAPMAQADSSQCSFANPQGLEFPPLQTGGKAFQQGDQPLQLLPEIHGQPPKHVYSDGQSDNAAGKAVPLPTARPHDLGKTPDARALADKTLHAIAIANADARGFGQPSRDAQAVVKQFLAEKAPLGDKDKPAALKKLGPAFDQAIRGADNTYAHVEKEAEPSIKAAKEGYIVANSTYNNTFDQTLEAAKALPEASQKRAAVLLAQVSLNGAELPGKDELTKVFKHDPAFLSSVLQLADHQKSVFTASHTLDGANKPVLEAALEQDRSRLAYERAAQSVGNVSLARSIDAERKLVAEQVKELTDYPEELRKDLAV
jgi:hypothetical protein